ncbi:MAG: 3-phosphoshikimate 1-carboxyvinyltransferase, partial [Phycisphaerae bacterium]|nr:3-phosphoshikimate 1-carboxyvinyltransferase [Phycisphaerae bacterium]
GDAASAAASAATSAGRRIDRAATPLRGRVQVPGSKSLSTRALVLAALSPTPVLLRGVLAADDTRHLAAAIGAMGGRVARLLGDDWRIDGREIGAASRRVEVDLGDGGAPVRFAMALATRRSGETRLDGSARLRERPIEDGVELLRALGASISYGREQGRLPVVVHGRLAGETATIRVARTASSQFVSALMLIAPSLPTGLRLEFTEAPTSASYLALTIESLRSFGAKLRGSAARAGDEIEIAPGLSPAGELRIPADASSAVVWAAAAAIVPGSRIEIAGVRRDAQPDRAAIEAIGRMGASIEWSDQGVTVCHAPLRGVDLDASSWPDGALAVAAAAGAASTPTRLRSLGTLRVKESDRLAAVRDEFGALGLHARIDGDDLVIEPREAPGAPVVVHAHRDHRIAMMLALVGLRRGGVIVDDPACVSKSYPAFWSHLAMLQGRGAGAGGLV